MDKPKKLPRPDIYERDLKIAIAREYLSSNLGYGALAKKYNLRNATVVRCMVNWYKKKFDDPAKFLVAEPTDSYTSFSDIREANLKIAALEMLVENASKEMGVDLIKKFGAKQSSK